MARNEHPEDEQVRALLAGRAFMDRSGWRRVKVGGADARGWLNDLVTAGVEDLADGEARRSLLLSPTGRIRADVDAVGMPDGLLLIQDPSQPDPIDVLLDRYVLSSDVQLVSAEVAVFARPVAQGRGPTYAVGSPPAGLIEATASAEEVWRLLRGDPRFGVDLDRDSLPAEGGLERTVDVTKGCFLGQESVAKVRNLGHPPRLLLHLEADGVVVAGAPVTSDGAEVGMVTSAARWEGRSVLLARVRWAARDAALSAGGEPLRAAPRPRGA